METGQSYRPGSTEELRDLLAEASAHGVAVEARGGGSKRAIGRPQRQTAIVDLSALAGIVDYEPSELVLSVRPATPLHEVEGLLAAHGQMLAFEPWDHARLSGSGDNLATIGGVVAAGVAGPRRLSAGGARDHLLGFTGVSGRAEVFKAGGKVVKNVTGYDLSKVIAGSWGQLTIMTELALKVVPRPKAVATVVLHGLTARSAVERMAQAMGSVASPTAAAHLPQTGSQAARTLLRLEGFAPSVNFRADQLRALLAQPGTEVIDDSASSAEWAHVREAASLAAHPAVWRIHVAPSQAAALAETLSRHDADWFMDWGGALIWAGAQPETDIQRLARQHGAHAMLVRGPDALMRTAPFRQSPQSAVTALSERVKRAFDPAGILDPDRFA